MAGVERAAIDPRCKTGGCYRPEPVRHVIGEAPVLGRGKREFFIMKHEEGRWHQAG